MNVKSLLWFLAILSVVGAPYVFGMRVPQFRPCLAPLSILMGSVLIGWMNHRSVQQRQRRVFAGRAPIEPQCIFDAQYAEAGVDRHRFIETWANCARLLGVSAEALRPSDRFAVELAPVNALDGIGHPLENLTDLAVRTCRRDKAAMAEYKQMKTFGELVCWLARRQDAPPSPWERLTSWIARRRTQAH